MTTWRDAWESINDDVQRLLWHSLFIMPEQSREYMKTWCQVVEDGIQRLEAELGCHFDNKQAVKALLFLRQSYQQVSNQDTGEPRSPPVYKMMVSSHCSRCELFNETLTRIRSEEIWPPCGCCRDQDAARTRACGLQSCPVDCSSSNMPCALGTVSDLHGMAPSRAWAAVQSRLCKLDHVRAGGHSQRNPPNHKHLYAGRLGSIATSGVP